jgi:hypothetical protein
MCEAALRHLERTCSLINVRTIIDVAYVDFFNFSEFFASIPPNLSSFVGLFSSGLIRAADQAHTALGALVVEKYDAGLCSQAISRLHRFLFELGPATFHVDVTPINDTIHAVCAFEALCDLALTFDCIDAFFPATEDNDGTICGSVLNRVRILALALQARLEKLAASEPSLYAGHFVLLQSVVRALQELPGRFGLVTGATAALARFCTAWRAFCNNFTPFPIGIERDSFRDAARGLLGALANFQKAGPEAAADIQQFQVLVDRFLITGDPALLFRLSLAFSFVEQQASRYLTPDALPALDVHAALKALQSLSLIHEAVHLIQLLTIAVNYSFCPDNPIVDPAHFVVESSAEVSGSEAGTRFLPEQLPLSDQTALMQLVRVLADANQAEQERLASLPYISDEVETLRSLLERMSEENKHLVTLNSVLAEIVGAASPNHASSEREEGVGIREQEELRLRVAAAEARRLEAENRYNEALARLKRIDEEERAPKPLRAARKLRVAAERLRASRASMEESLDVLRATEEKEQAGPLVAAEKQEPAEQSISDEMGTEELRGILTDKQDLIRAIIEVLDG